MMSSELERLVDEAVDEQRRAHPDLPEWMHLLAREAALLSVAGDMPEDTAIALALRHRIEATLRADLDAATGL